MSFLTLSALAIALFVAAPIAAHLLRRKRAEERLFPAARLVPPTPPTARRRSSLEDRALFLVRALAVLSLAALGATPFIHCSRLALGRKSGASVALAIVVDDSLSMRAPINAGTGATGPTRFDRALSGARELTQGLAGGDAVAIVLAGAPARVALASTTDMGAALATLAELQPSDRATDLDGALELARGLVRGLAQPDKRIVLLSNLADGNPNAAPLAATGDLTLWAPLPELEASGDDCGITRADRTGNKIWVRVVCSPPASARKPTADAAPSATASPSASASAAPTSKEAGHDGAPQGPASETASKGRSVEIRAGARVLKSVALGPSVRVEEVPLEVPSDATGALRAVLTGSDAIAEDDEAPVVAAGGALPMAVVVDATAVRVATGGPPPIEQALTALELDAEVRPLPALPEHAEELARYAAVVIDDPPGFTPEVRRALQAWVERGGVVLLTLGPRAAAAPLGASFEPLVPGVVRWGATPSEGIDPATASSFGPSAEGLLRLAPHGRATLDPAALTGGDVLARWRDGAPFLLRRSLRRGAVMTLTLPLTTEESDLALRPAFLALLDRFVGTARARGGARRIDVGEAWTFDGYAKVVVERETDGAKPTPIPVADATPESGGHEGHRLRAVPPLAGLYDLELDGDKTTRVAAIADREIDLRPRRIESGTHAKNLGGSTSSIDASPYVALGLLGLLCAELALRLWSASRTQRTA